MTASTVKLFARHEHGGHEVRVIDGPDDETHFEVTWPDDRGAILYTSGRKLVRALYNDGETGPETRDPGMSVDRYFRIGKYAPRVPSPSPALDLIMPKGASMDQVLVANGLGHKIRRGPIRPRKAREKKTCRRKITRKINPLLIGVRGKILTGKAEPLAPVLGIDLENRSHEVRKLLFAGFGKLIASRSYDPEDVYQEVLRGILARNYGKCPWDSRKSTFGHYVHMVCDGVVKNYHRKQARRAEFEQLGMYGYDGDGDYGMVDAAEVDASRSLTHAEAKAPSNSVGMELAMGSLTDYLMETGSPEAGLAVQALPLLAEGMTRKEIAQRLKREPSRVGKALALIRKTAAVWKEDQGI